MSYLKNEEQTSEKKYRVMFSTEMKATFKNSANLEQETKTTKIVTYPLLSLASSSIELMKILQTVNCVFILSWNSM